MVILDDTISCFFIFFICFFVGIKVEFGRMASTGETGFGGIILSDNERLFKIWIIANCYNSFDTRLVVVQPSLYHCVSFWWFILYWHSSSLFGAPGRIRTDVSWVAARRMKPSLLPGLGSGARIRTWDLTVNSRLFYR